MRAHGKLGLAILCQLRMVSSTDTCKVVLPGMTVYHAKRPRPGIHRALPHAKNIFGVVEWIFVDMS